MSYHSLMANHSLSLTILCLEKEAPYLLVSMFMLFYLHYQEITNALKKK